MAQANTSAGIEDKDSMSPVVAAILSLIVPGLGQILGGQTNRGVGWIAAAVIYYLLAFVLTFFLVGIVLFLVAPILHIAAAADAYIQNN
jgi:TM2 domain-containing membrane protein YozV